MSTVIDLPRSIRTPKTLALLCAYYSPGGIDDAKLQQIARALIQGGNFRQARIILRGALALVSKFADTRDKAERLISIAEDLTGLGHPRRTQQVLLLAEAAANSMEWIDAKEIVLTRIAIAYAKAGYPQKASPLAADLKDKDCGWWAQQAIIGALADRDQGMEALSTAARLPTDAAKSWAWSRIALAVAKTGDAQLARELFRQALVFANLVGDADEKCETLRVVAENLTKAGDIQQARSVAQLALATANQIKRPHIRVDRYRLIAEVLALSKDNTLQRKVLRDAAEATGQIESKDERIRMQMEIAVALARNGYTDHLRVIAQEALIRARQNEDGTTKADALCDIGRTFLKAGDRRSAAKTFDEALIAAKRLHDEHLVINVAVGLAEAGQAWQAATAADECRDFKALAFRAVGWAIAMPEVEDSQPRMKPSFSPDDKRAVSVIAWGISNL